MTVTTTKLANTQADRIVDQLRRALLAMFDMAASLGRSWRDDFSSGQLGPDPETVIGRDTGARI
jgi:hypothetical protein